MKLFRSDVEIRVCENSEADQVYIENYWLKRIRRSRRISFCGFYKGKKVAWVQCADPFGTKLAKPIQMFEINESVELCRGYFIEETPSNLESCVIGKVMKVISNEWFKRFNVTKKIAIVYQDLDAGQRGIVYKAAGFKPYAKCRRARHYSVPARGNSKGNKILWAKALNPINGHHYNVVMPSNYLSNYELEEMMSCDS